MERHVPAVGEAKDTTQPQSRHISPLRHVEAFFEVICNANEDGRVVLLRGDPANGGQPSIKFMLLNPAVYFEEILLQSRAVILAGGTMTPMNDFIDQLTTPDVSHPPVRTPLLEPGVLFLTAAWGPFFVPRTDAAPWLCPPTDFALFLWTRCGQEQSASHGREMRADGPEL